MASQNVSAADVAAIVSSENFFECLYSAFELKIFYILFHAFITFAGPSLLYSIVWYERYSADLWYRTLMNQLLTRYCQLSIIGCFCSRLPYVAMIIFGPFSESSNPVLL